MRHYRRAAGLLERDGRRLSPTPTVDRLADRRAPREPRAIRRDDRGDARRRARVFVEVGPGRMLTAAGRLDPRRTPASRGRLRPIGPTRHSRPAACTSAGYSLPGCRFDFEHLTAAAPTFDRGVGLRRDRRENTASTWLVNGVAAATSERPRAEAARRPVADMSASLTLGTKIVHRPRSQEWRPTGTLAIAVQERQDGPDARPPPPAVEAAPVAGLQGAQCSRRSEDVMQDVSCREAPAPVRWSVPLRKSRAPIGLDASRFPVWPSWASTLRRGKHRASWSRTPTATPRRAGHGTFDRGGDNRETEATGNLARRLAGDCWRWCATGPGIRKSAQHRPRPRSRPRDRLDQAGRDPRGGRRRCLLWAWARTAR